MDGDSWSERGEDLGLVSALRQCEPASLPSFYLCSQAHHLPWQCAFAALGVSACSMGLLKPAGPGLC